MPPDAPDEEPPDEEPPDQEPADEGSLRRKPATSGDPHPVEHFIEVLLIAQDRAVAETREDLRKVWQATIRDIETVLADDPAELVGVRDRLAARDDPEGRRMHACVRQLLAAFDAADRDARQVIERARKG